ncbi:hypothetical protein CS0771_58010 [Catellatospora sp. IY07-71]|uniref:hypothetical protein n=1 Tax=Catellatospora sp. IY07-71 TaxID=2728827 RepID=UPI001BB42A74|nr:hypothetical protein [Catellatospora sp. IY07-71]BCJ76257.1 hypothetical protein CS0771_58010 [Catellatospora sp. IY07-71]
MSGVGSGSASPGAKSANGGGCLSGVPLLLCIGGAVFGVLMILCTGGKLAADQSGPGVWVIIVSISLGTLIVGWVMRGSQAAGKTGAGVAALLLLALSVGVTLAAVTGLLVRWQAPASYHARVGTLVTAQLPNGCAADVPAKIRRGTRIDIECEGARWQDAGQDRTGTIVIASADMGSGYQAPAQIDAYVIDDKGFSVAEAGRQPSIGGWGAMPLWPLLPALLVGAGAGYLLRRLRWSADTPA